MKQYIIGRGQECTIRLNDTTQRISREHATLKITEQGKIFICDSSSNGTFVNGIKISQGVDFPVKRGDSISFANVCELNWELIPKRSNVKVIFFSIIAVLVVAIVIACILFFRSNTPTPYISPERVIDAVQMQNDEVEKQEEIDMQSEVEKQDSISLEETKETKGKEEVEKQKQDSKKPKSEEKKSTKKPENEKKEGNKKGKSGETVIII